MLLRNRGVNFGLSALVVGLILTGCSSDENSEAAAIVSGTPTSIVQLPPSGETIQMTVGQLGEFVALPDDKEYVIESSDPAVVDVFNGYADDSGIEIAGPGVVAFSVGEANITVSDPELAGEPFESFRILVTEPSADE